MNFSIFNFFIRKTFRDRLFSIINITGLSVGITASLLIALFVLDEYSFDQFHKNRERIVKLGTTGRFSGEFVSNPIVGALKEQLPEVEKSTRLLIHPPTLVEANDQRNFEDGVAAIDEDFLSIFSFADEIDSELGADEVILTKSIAQKYFGESSPIGEPIQLDREKDYIIKGVVDDPPANSSISFSILKPIDNKDYMWYIPTDGYVLLSEGVSYEQWGEKLEEADVSTMGIPANFAESIQVTSRKFEEVHLKSQMSAGQSNSFYVRVFSMIGLVIVLIACVNYINLSTAKSVRKIREVGIRKALGASRRTLVWSFFQETLVMVLLAGVIAFGLLERLLPYFEEIIGRSFTVTVLDSSMITLVILLWLIVSFLSGIYPAVHLSKFQPVKVLKSGFSSPKSKGYRSVLTGFQFFISLSLVILTALVWFQLNYMRSADLGFERESKVVLKLPEGVGDWESSLKNEVTAIPGIERMSYAAWVPGVFMTWSTKGGDIEGYTGDPEEQVMFNFCLSDVDYLAALGLRVVEGRWFSEDIPTDENALVVTEAAKSLFGETPTIGAKVSMQGKEFTVIGIVEDLREVSFKSPVGPAMFQMAVGNMNRYALLNIAGENLSEQQLEQLEAAWDQFVPEYPLQHYVLTDDLSRAYAKEEGLNKLFNAFSIISISICLLGLLGLSAYMQERRQKEFSIHKVLGASMKRLVRLVVVDYLKVIGISLILALPVVYYFGNAWLQNFEYRFEFQLLGFAWPVMTVITICIAASMFFIIRLARVNPAETLRNE